MIKITDTLSIQENDIQIDFTASTGPPAQNDNKVASQAQLRNDTTHLE
jgi:protein subunit release factor B